MRWPPYKNVFFDCDSTLTTVEGIDVLAETAGKKWRVEVLTNAAMNGSLDLEDVYEKRLKAVRPTRGQVSAIRNSYKKNTVEDAAAVIEALQALHHNVFIISGGLYEPVKEFGISLGVPEENIRAVGVQYDTLSGEWWNLANAEHEARYKQYEEGALTISDGKAEIVRELLAQSDTSPKDHSLLIGDGSSDLLASRSVDLFVGYGGVIARERVQREAPVFIHSLSLAPLLSLVLGPAGLLQLKDTSQEYLVDKCLQLIEKGDLTFNHERLNQKFTKAHQAIFARPN
ncbi:MAG: HAD-IB family phosphatase [Anaerolineales bacterium]|nr:HAD-IB family phosphatase [Anaerolineales bacterium]